MVLSESTDENGEIVLTRLYENIKDHNAKRSRRYDLSISVGTTQFDPEDPISIDELLSKADALMYTQKREKSNFSKKPWDGRNPWRKEVGADNGKTLWQQK